MRKILIFTIIAIAVSTTMCASIKPHFQNYIGWTNYYDFRKFEGKTIKQSRMSGNTLHMRLSDGTDITMQVSGYNIKQYNP